MSSYKQDAYLLLINADNPIKSVSDLEKPGASLRIGAGRAGSSNRHFALIAKDVLGLDNINIIPGYPGATNIFLAMQTGEVDGQVIGYGSSKAGQRALWDAHKLRALIQFGRVDRHSDFPDVPTGRELAKTDKQRALVEFAELAFFMAMPMLAPPNIPEDRAQALQKAFMQMCADPQFVAEANKLGLEVSPVDAQGIKTLLKRAAETPKDVMAQYVKLIGH
jgi:tripartite-type tricarboxylate transporter receptor subunit TctC